VASKQPEHVTRRTQPPPLLLLLCAGVRRQHWHDHWVELFVIKPWKVGFCADKQHELQIAPLVG
jgi:hypothetical protein